MKKFTMVFVLLILVSLFTGCGDSATAITGTLPVVNGIVLDTLNSLGDTLVVRWTPLDSTLVEGYFLWTRTGTEGAWSLASTVETSPGVHIANSSAFYTVTAYNGDNISSDIGIPTNTRSTGLEENRTEFSGRAVGYRIDITGDSLIAGDPANSEFNQDFVVAMTMELERYVYRGSAKPDLWPGGARTAISSRGGYVAPSPDDPTAWKDSLLYGQNMFISLDSNYFCLLNQSQTIPDTLTFTDSLVIDGQIQPLRGVRVFNRN